MECNSITNGDRLAKYALGESEPVEMKEKEKKKWYLKIFLKDFCTKNCFLYSLSVKKLRNEFHVCQETTYEGPYYHITWAHPMLLKGADQ